MSGEEEGFYERYYQTLTVDELKKRENEMDNLVFLSIVVLIGAFAVSMFISIRAEHEINLLIDGDTAIFSKIAYAYNAVNLSFLGIGLTMSLTIYYMAQTTSLAKEIRARKYVKRALEAMNKQKGE